MQTERAPVLVSAPAPAPASEFVWSTEERGVKAEMEAHDLGRAQYRGGHYY